MPVVAVVVVLVVFMVGCAIGPPAAPSPPKPGSTPTPPITISGCGVERWSVKTLMDADASRIDFAPIRTTVSALAALPAHCGVAPDRRVYAEELQVFEVVGRITVARGEDDHDFHVAIVDPGDPTATMVTEVADPQCSGPAPRFARNALESARLDFGALVGGRSLSALAGETVIVRGVGFYDQNHGQTGRAASCIEIHPVLSIARAGP